MIANRAVVANMSIGHQEYVAAQPRDSSAFGRAPVDGHVFADGVVIADLDAGLLPAKTQVLGLHADGAKRKEAIMGADLRRTLDGHMRNQFAALTQFHSRANYAKRANGTRSGNFCGWINDCS